MTPVNLATEIERLREKLLDLSNRNPLINYRKSARRTMQVVDELPSVIYERLVAQGRRFYFDCVPDPPEPAGNAGQIDATKSLTSKIGSPSDVPVALQSPVGPDPEVKVETRRYATELPFQPDSKASETGHLFDDRLQTNLTKKKLDSVLRYMQREARTAQQETGINYLHLALGFLSWKESESSDTERLAPLILIPVQIETVSDARSGQTQFVVSWTEDDVTGNLCLFKKLERDFRLKLNDFDLESDPESYFTDVLDRTKAHPSWEVKREALIGFFSFHKLSMYADIDPKQWNLDSDDAKGMLVEQVICGAEGPPAEATLYARDYEIDSHEAADDILLAMDCDSSQHSALCDIRAGKNLVIEGPPGTGKSQTIANAIADAIGAGKTVLFVAEKLTALQVVHNRLSDLGLSEFCLELHSDGASPRHVYQGLSQRLGAEFRTPQQLETLRQSLERQRRKLNEYVSEMGQPVGPNSDPLYKVLWQIVGLRNDGAITCHASSDSPNRDAESFHEAVHLLGVFATRLAETPEPQASPWWGFFPDALGFQKFPEIESTVASLRSHAQALREQASNLATNACVPSEGILKHAESLSPSDLRHLAATVPDLESEQLLKMVDAAVLQQAAELTAEIARRGSIILALEGEFGVAWDDVQHLESRFADLLKIAGRPSVTAAELNRVCDRLAAEPIEKSSLGGIPQDVAVPTPESLAGCYRSLRCPTPNSIPLARVFAQAAWAKQSLKAVQMLQTAGKHLNASGIGKIESFRDYPKAVRITQLLNHPIMATEGCVTEKQFTSEGKSAYQTAFTTSEQLRQRKESLDRSFYMPSVPDSDELSKLTKTLRRNYRSWMRIFNREYREAKASLAEFTQVGQKRSISQWIRGLQDLQTLSTEIQAFADNPELRGPMGSYFRGMETDWAQVKTLFDWVHTARQHGLDHARVKALLDRRADMSEAIPVRSLKSLQEQFEELFIRENQFRPAGLDSAAAQSQSLTDLEVALKKLDAALDGHCEALINASKQILEFASENGLAEFTLDRIGGLVDQVNAIHKLDQVSRDESRWQRLVDARLYDEALNQPDLIDAACKWINSLNTVYDSCSAKVLESIMRSGPANSLTSLASSLEAVVAGHERLAQTAAKLESFAETDDGWLDIGEGAIVDGSLESRVAEMQSHISDLPAWSAFSRSLMDCRRNYLGKYCNAAMVGEVAPSILAASYQLTELEREVQSVFRASTLLQRATGASLDAIRKDFQEYDRQVRDLNREEIAHRASRRDIPAGNGRGRVGEFTELALIRHETQKQQRHCRIRDLIQRAGAATQGLKPCFMMSPLSVSRFIPQDTVNFDMVIMDEASQIKPEDALGTILRTKQLVVVGDPKQLPPTSFFDKLGEEVDEDESTQMDNTESILEASMKVFQPFRRLRWHYRSKHESLIRFSNTSFYDDDLVVFPSTTDEGGNLGVSSVFVEGATFTGGANVKEAEAVVSAIIDHAMVRPDDSLGVGAFNKKQAELIYELLEKRCDEDAAARLAVSRLKEHEEELFIKNLENVQGDERDVIFIAYTYGPDPASGRMFQRFGPINSDKGWRRLNVLVTRSKKAMVVFHSMRPSDVIGGPEKSRGVNAYKDFLSYAITGSLGEQGTIAGREPDSPFEIAVSRAIHSMGMEAVPQVGVAGFFIDIGVRPREGDKSFVLGVECDGATYHSARSARDRDRLREEIIRARGWKIHRIWSTDWFLNQRKEEEKLRNAIRNAMETISGSPH